MRQNTTATITCNISPADVLADALDVGITILQDSTGVCFEFSSASGSAVIDTDAGTVSCVLSRDQTKAFDVGPALVQVTGKTSSYTYWASSIAKIIVYRTLGGVV